MTAGVEVPRSRRALLGAAIGALAATATQALGRPAQALATDGQPVIQGQSNSGSALTAIISSASTGLSGETHAAGHDGVFGIAWALTGSTTYGVEGISNSPAGAGVRGEGSVGVYGSSSAGSGAVVGVRGVVGSPAGAGVKGQNISTDLAARGVVGNTPTG